MPWEQIDNEWAGPSFLFRFFILESFISCFRLHLGNGSKCSVSGKRAKVALLGVRFGQGRFWQGRGWPTGLGEDVGKHGVCQPRLPGVNPQLVWVVIASLARVKGIGLYPANDPALAVKLLVADMARCSCVHTLNILNMGISVFAWLCHGRRAGLLWAGCWGRAERMLHVPFLEALAWLAHFCSSLLQHWTFWRNAQYSSASWRRQLRLNAVGIVLCARPLTARRAYSLLAVLVNWWWLWVAPQKFSYRVQGSFSCPQWDLPSMLLLHASRSRWRRSRLRSNLAEATRLWWTLSPEMMS